LNDNPTKVFHEKIAIVTFPESYAYGIDKFWKSIRNHIRGTLVCDKLNSLPVSEGIFMGILTQKGNFLRQYWNAK